MAYQTVSLPSFGGIRMDLCEGLLKPDMSPDACNLDTRSGALRTASGFSRVMPEPVEAERSLERMYVYTTELGNRYLAAAQDVLYLYDENAHLWRTLYQFTNGVMGESMDFLRVRIGTADRLLIACGTEPMITFDAATDRIEPFGSAESCRISM